MSSGVPLTDADREPWLLKINQIAKEHIHKGCVIACSALKEQYRERLSASIASEVTWIYLEGSFDEIYERMRSRRDHFMKPDLLRSQFDILEVPEEAIKLPITMDTEQMINRLMNR